MTRVCMEIGAKNDNGQPMLIPFFIIDGIMVQYTFGEACPKETVKFENQLGKIKLAMFQSIADSVMINPIDSTDKEFIKRTMLTRLQTAKDKGIKCILFIIKKKPNDDTPFYEAFNIKAESSKPISAKELGITVKEPFAIHPMEEVKNDMETMNCPIVANPNLVH